MATSVESNPPAKDDMAVPPKPRDGVSPAPTPPAPAPAPTASAKSSPSADAAAAAPKSTASKSPSPSAKSGSSVKDPRGSSSIDEVNLERTILRRGLATQAEIDGCKAQRAKTPGKPGPTGMLEVMIGAGVLTKSQGLRLLKEIGPGQDKFEVPGYQILDRLGKGSMGVVYKAKQLSVDRIVAVKVLLEALAQNKEFIKRFEREAKIAAKLSHNNIVNAIDAGDVGGHHYFVMEYVEGKTVKDYLDEGKVFDEKTALKIVIAVGEALAHAHHRGLIHRDIKPENVILTRDGNVKLADLGLARPTADEKWAMAEAGMAIGTPYYISPEQVRGQVDVDIRADIYGLGASLYHMVTGRVPYPGDNPNEVMKKHVDKNCVLVPPDHLNDKLSSGLGIVVETMMSKNRDDRYSSPDDALLDLKSLLAGDPPMIANQKLDALSGLSEAADEGGVEASSSVTEEEKAEMAGVANMRGNIIAALGVLLILSIVSNLLLLLTR